MHTVSIIFITVLVRQLVSEAMVDFIRETVRVFFVEVVVSFIRERLGR